MSRGVAVVLLAWCVVTVGACAKSAAPDWAGAAVRFVHKIDGAPDGAERLMFATYNVAGGARPAGVAADVGRLAHVNAWAFQEVAVPDAAADVAIARVMPAGRWHWVVVPLNERTDDGRAREGQAIACRWPIEAVAVWPLPTGAGEKRRAAIAATLATPDGPVLLVNADLALGFFDASYGSRRQVAELARRLRAVGAPRVVVAGDFNTAGNLWRLHGSDAAIHRLTAALTPAGFAPLPDRSPHDATFRDVFGVRQLDHVYTRGLRAHRWATAADATGSDHLPVWCELASEPLGDGGDP